MVLHVDSIPWAGHMVYSYHLFVLKGKVNSFRKLGCLLQWGSQNRPLLSK